MPSAAKRASPPRASWSGTKSSIAGVRTRIPITGHNSKSDMAPSMPWHDGHPDRTRRSRSRTPSTTMIIAGKATTACQQATVDTEREDRTTAIAIKGLYAELRVGAQAW
jgi:hypothetical protein